MTKSLARAGGPWYILAVDPTAAVMVAVCADPEVAAQLVARGARVVLYGADAERLAGVLSALRQAGGRVGALIGDPDDPGVEEAARAMAAELFGGEPIVVGSGTVDPHPDH